MYRRAFLRGVGATGVAASLAGCSASRIVEPGDPDRDPRVETDDGDSRVEALRARVNETEAALADREARIADLEAQLADSETAAGARDAEIRALERERAVLLYRQGDSVRSVGAGERTGARSAFKARDYALAARRYALAAGYYLAAAKDFGQAKLVCSGLGESAGERLCAEAETYADYTGQSLDHYSKMCYYYATGESKLGTTERDRGRTDATRAGEHAIAPVGDLETALGLASS